MNICLLYFRHRRASRDLKIEDPQLVIYRPFERPFERPLESSSINISLSWREGHKQVFNKGENFSKFSIDRRSFAGVLYVEQLFVGIL